MTRVVRLFRGNVRSDDVQQYGLEAEPLGRMKMCIRDSIYVIGFIFLGEYAYDAEWPEGTGFVISTLVFLSGAQVLTGYRNPFYISLISAGISAFLYAVFAIFFKVPLP